MKNKTKKNTPVETARDLNGKDVFKDPILCSQFLRDNLHFPFCKNVQPEDIEDVTERYRAYLGTEFSADTVKKIHLRDDEGNESDMPLYLIPIIEHKSSVDYNVAMQLLRYMVCIWHEYGKEMEKTHTGITKTKGFRYPPILPIVYYEGLSQWTAPMRLSERIQSYDKFKEYMPDFTYELVRNCTYTNEELLARGNEMSLIMMFNKVQSAEDFRELRQLPLNQVEQVDEIYGNAPEYLKGIIKDVVSALMAKMNVPSEEADEYIKMLGEKRMGYFFENMEKMDIQAERANTAKAKADAEAAKADAEAAKAALGEAEKMLEALCKEFISESKSSGCSQEEMTVSIMRKFHLSREDAEKKVKQY